ncbi:MAG: 50S ribosomal protein L25 [Bacteroidia bacterium]|nr:MAG: 50S ribosomal protein L25 [Bacteroidia bacterium]
MKTAQLKAEKRNTQTKGDLNQLRKSGFVPGNVFGENTNLQIKIDERALKKLIYTPDTFLVQLEVDGQVYPTIIKEVQFHKVTDRPIHVDFQVVNENKPITVTLPVVTKGQAEGVKAGGKLQISMRRVKVKGLVKDIPDILELDITNLGVGKTITCGDIKINGVTLLHPDNLAIVGVKVTRNVIEDTTAAQAPTAQATSSGQPTAAKK